MLLSEMDPLQRAMLESFEAALQSAGWDTQAAAAMLRAGMSVTPEGIATYERGGRFLSAELDVAAAAVLLRIHSKATGKTVRLQFYLKPGETAGLLSWLTARQDELDPVVFARHLKQAAGYASEIHFIDGEGRHYPLEVPKG